MLDPGHNWVSSIGSKGMTRLSWLLYKDHPKKLDETWVFTRMGKKCTYAALCCKLCHAACEVSSTTARYKADEEMKLARFLFYWTRKRHCKYSHPRLGVEP